MPPKASYASVGPQRTLTVENVSENTPAAKPPNRVRARSRTPRTSRGRVGAGTAKDACIWRGVPERAGSPSTALHPWGFRPSRMSVNLSRGTTRHLQPPPAATQMEADEKRKRKEVVEREKPRSRRAPKPALRKWTSNIDKETGKDKEGRLRLSHRALLLPMKKEGPPPPLPPSCRPPGDAEHQPRPHPQSRALNREPASRPTRRCLCPAGEFGEGAHPRSFPRSRHRVLHSPALTFLFLASLPPRFAAPGLPTSKYFNTSTHHDKGAL